VARDLGGRTHNKIAWDSHGHTGPGRVRDHAAGKIARQCCLEDESGQARARRLARRDKQLGKTLCWRLKRLRLNPGDLHSRSRPWRPTIAVARGDFAASGGPGNRQRRMSLKTEGGFGRALLVRADSDCRASARKSQPAGGAGEKHAPRSMPERGQGRQGRHGDGGSQEWKRAWASWRGKAEKETCARVFAKRRKEKAHRQEAERDARKASSSDKRRRRNAPAHGGG